MNKTRFIIVMAVLTVANIVFLQQWRMNYLSNQLELSEMRANVNTEFANELLWLQLNDVENQTANSLIAQGRIEGMVNYYAQDDQNRQHIDNLWHEGYMRGLSQIDWEHDAVSEVNYNKGYRDAIETAFPEGNYPKSINLPTREVEESAIAEPNFDKAQSGLSDNAEVIDALNKKLEQVTQE